jgi:hypothetical protein
MSKGDKKMMHGKKKPTKKKPMKKPMKKKPMKKGKKGY